MKLNYNSIFSKFIKFISCVFVIFNMSTMNTFSNTLQKLTFGKEAIKHIKYLSKTPRVSGTKLIINSQKYIKNEFQKYGYDVEEQDFVWPIENNKNHSKNIIAYKKGLNDQQIIIGAHYDSTNCNGADDNASGISALLELSQKLNKIILPYTLKFIAFDAEEVGLFGSRYFVKNMSPHEKINTILYINIDSILSGDDLYIYGDNGIRGWFRDEILSLSKEKNLSIKTSPGLEFEDKSFSIPEGECFDYSDHVYFKYEGIPFAYLESTSWNSMNPRTGYPNYRNSNFGMIIHSNRDNLNFINQNLGSKYEDNLSKCIELIYFALINQNKSITIITNTEDSSSLKNIKYELYKNNKLIDTLSHNDSKKITISNLERGKYKIKQLNSSNVKFKCNMNDKYFELSSFGNLHILYEDLNALSKCRDYDAILLNIYGNNFNDPQIQTDELYKQFIKIKNIDPKSIYDDAISLDEIKNQINEYSFKNLSNDDSIATFSNSNSLSPKYNPKLITKMFSSIVISFFYSGLYKIKNSNFL